MKMPPAGSNGVIGHAAPDVCRCVSDNAFFSGDSGDIGDSLYLQGFPCPQTVPSIGDIGDKQDCPPELSPLVPRIFLSVGTAKRPCLLDVPVVPNVP
jgi:hypothetical protein